MVSELWRFCLSKECQHHMEWEYETTMGQYSSTIECSCCLLVGKTENIDEVPSQCIHHAEMKQYELERKQKQMWDRLQTVNKPHYVKPGVYVYETDVSSFYPALVTNPIVRNDVT